MNCSVDRKLAVLAGLFAFATLTSSSLAEEVGEMWGTAVRERAYYRVVDLPIPKGLGGGGRGIRHLARRSHRGRYPEGRHLHYTGS